MLKLEININEVAIAEKVDSIIQEVSNKMNTYGLKVVEEAKRLAPVDEGHLRNSISYFLVKREGVIEVDIVAATNYAAYIEFGTRKYASAYVSTLPSEWQEFAAEYRGTAGSGSLYDFFLAILDWMKRKGIKAGTYSVKTRRRTGNKIVKQNEDIKLAEAIAYSILKKGIKPKPFLYPAITNNKIE